MFICLCNLNLLVLQPTEPKVAYNRATDILKKVTKPTEAEAQALAKYFPSNSSRPRFDPKAECLKSTKKGSRKKNERPCAVTVVMMKKFTSCIPKGKVRKQMVQEGKIHTLRINRSASASAKYVTDKIENAFKVSNFTILECGAALELRSCDQVLDGEVAVERRGSLYLCEYFEVRIVQAGTCSK